MILASWNAIPRNKLYEPLKGPAKVYDGAFDYDEFSGFDDSELFDEFSICITFQTNDIDKYQDLFTTRIEDPSGVLITLRKSGGIVRPSLFFTDLINGIGIEASFDSVLLQDKNILIITHDGTMTPLGVKFELNGVEYAGRLVLSETVSKPSMRIRKAQIGAWKPVYATRNLKLDGTIKQFEIINRVATAQEIADASDPITGGSFRSAGIAHNSGNYLLALNTDQTDGNPPTTFPNTPSYTIISFGGAEYVNYEDL